mgnify:CR=1 FL=1
MLSFVVVRFSSQRSYRGLADLSLGFSTRANALGFMRHLMVMLLSGSWALVMLVGRGEVRVWTGILPFFLI